MMRRLTERLPIRKTIALPLAMKNSFFSKYVQWSTGVFFHFLTKTDQQHSKRR